MRPIFVFLLLVLSRLSAQASSASWRTEVQTAQGLIQNGEYRTAESHLRTALQSASNDAQLALTWNDLGSVYVDIGKYHEAENALRRSLRHWTKCEGSASEQKANALNSLGGLLANQGRFREAQQYLEESLALRRSSHGRLDVTPALNNLALVKLAQRRYRDAQALLSEALTICQSGERPCTVALSPIHHNLARTALGLGRDQDAVAKFQASIAAGEEIFGAGHPKVGWTYFELATVSMRLGDHELAGSLFQKILATQERYRLGAHPLVAATLERHSKLLERQKRSIEAKAMMRRAKAMKAELADLDRLGRRVVDWETLRASANSFGMSDRAQGKLR